MSLLSIRFHDEAAETEAVGEVTVRPDAVRVLLVVIAAYMIWKTASAPKRGTFLTLFGNIGRESQPRTFRACLIAGYASAVALILGAAFPDVWLPIFSGL